MPFHCPLPSPPKICRSRRSVDSNSGEKLKKNPRKSLTKNFDDELLQHVEDMRRLSSEGARGPSEGGGAGRSPSPSMPFSKDFGTYDLTLCLANDGRCVVLVEYEQRIFVNGRQMYLTDSGRVLDRQGKPNAKFQEYYDQAIMIKKRLRGTGRRNPDKKRKSTNNSPIKEQTRLSLNRDDRQVLEKNQGTTFETELTELEAAFGRIVARLCKLILDVIGRETGDASISEDASAQSSRRDILDTTLGRLSDQLQSAIELSTSLKIQHGCIEVNQNVWVAEDVRLTSGGDTTGLELETNGEDRASQPDVARVPSSRRSGYLVTKPHALWEENQSLRRDVKSLEIELNQLEQLHRKVEDQFFEAESDRVDAQNERDAARAEIAALKKQLVRLTNGKGAKSDSTSSVECSTSNLVSRFAKRLSGSARNTSPAGSRSSSTCSSSNDDDSKRPDVVTTDPEKKQQDTCILEGFSALDRHYNLRSEMKRLREVYRNMEEDMERLGVENGSLRMRLMKLERERKDMQEKMEKAEDLSEDRNRRLEYLDGVNSKLDARCSRLARDKAALEADIIKVNALYAETGSRLRTLERELIELEKTHKETETEKRQCRDKLDVLNEAHLEECNKASRLLQEKASIEVQLGVLRREQGERVAELDKMRVENKANASGRLHAEKENARLERELRDAARRQIDLTDELLSLQRSLSKYETTSKSLEAAEEELRSRCNRLDAEAGEMKSRSEELYLGKRMLEEENSCLKEMNRQLQRENTEIQDTVASLTSTNAGIRAKMKQWNRDNVSMEKKMKQIVHAKAELHGVIKQLNTVQTDIENRFEKLDSEYADFQKRLAKGGKSCLTVEGRVAFEDDFQRECEELKKQLHDRNQSHAEKNGEVEGHSSKGDDRRSSFKAIANLKNEFTELEKEILGQIGHKTEKQKGSSQIGNDVTFVSACSDLESGDQGMWWDDTGELNTSLVSGNEEK